jgi:hypothetical protein
MYERKDGEKGDRRGVSRNEANTAYRLSVVVANASEVYLRDAYTVHQARLPAQTFYTRHTS